MPIQTASKQRPAAGYAAGNNVLAETVPSVTVDFPFPDPWAENRPPIRANSTKVCRSVRGVGDRGWPGIRKEGKVGFYGLTN